MIEDIKRMRFFDGLFLTEEEFNLEQRYHQRFRHLHNKWFHGWGVIDGLEVTASSGIDTINISKGAALCYTVSDQGEESGREIVLLENSPLELPELSIGEAIYIYIEFSEKHEDRDPDKGGGELIHWREKPIIGYLDANPINDTKKVTLARVTLVNDETTGDPVLKISYESADQQFRKFAGFNGKEVETEKLVLRTSDGVGNMANLVAKPGSNSNHGIQVNSPHTNLAGNLSTEGGLLIGGNTEPLTGTLDVKGNSNIDGNLSVKGNSVVGQSSLKRELNVQGNLLVSDLIESQGNLNVGGTTQLTGALQVGSSTSLLGDLTIGSDLDPANLNTKGSVTIKDDLTVSNTLQVTGNSTFGGPLTTSDDATINGDLTITNNLAVSDTLLVSTVGDNNVTIAGDILIEKKGDSSGGNLGVKGNCTIEGELNVIGSKTQINTVDLEVQDNIVLLNKSDAANVDVTLTSGIEIFRGTSQAGQNAKLLWYETDQKWKLGIDDNLKSIIDESILGQSLEGLESSLLDEISKIGSEGGFAAIISSLSERINVQKQLERHQALLTDPVREKNSVMAATLGLLLDLARVAYVLILEYFDLVSLQNSEIGNSTSINLKGFYFPRNMPHFMERAEQRFKALSSNDFQKTCFYLFLYDLFIETPNKAGIVYLKTFAKKYQLTDVRPAAWNGRAAMEEFLEKIYGPLIGTDSELNYKSTEVIRGFIFNSLKNLWQKVIEELLLAPDPKLDFTEETWKKLESEVIKVAEPLGKTLNGYGLVSWWEYPIVIQKIFFQQDVDENNGNSWIVSSNNLMRINNKTLLLRWEEDVKKDIIDPLLPDITIDFPDRIVEIRQSDLFLFVLLSSNLLFTMPFSKLNSLTNDIPATEFGSLELNVRFLLSSGGGQTEALFLRYDPNLGFESGIEVFDGEKQDVTVKIRFALEEIAGRKDWLDPYNPNIFTLSMAKDKEIISPFVLAAVNDMDHQILYIGETGISPWWSQDGLVKWLMEIHLHNDYSLLGGALDQLIINRHSESQWAFVPFISFFPKLWSVEAKDFLAGILKTKASDGIELFNVTWYNPGMGDVAYDGPSTLEFKEGRIFDYCEDSANRMLSLNNSNENWVTLYRCFNELVPTPVSKIWMGENRYNSMVAHHIQDIKSNPLELMTVAGYGQTLEYQKETIKQ